jgi:hypothetical protein
LPPEGLARRVTRRPAQSAAAPEAMRTSVKVAGSARRGPRAARQRRELAAKQARDDAVRTTSRTHGTARSQAPAGALAAFAGVSGCCAGASAGWSGPALGSVPVAMAAAHRGRTQRAIAKRTVPHSIGVK